MTPRRNVSTHRERVRVETRVVWHNSMLNVIREPVEAVVGSDGAPWNFGKAIQKMDWFFRHGGR